MARTYLYRLDVTYPPGSDEPDWAPSGWGADESHWEQEADTGAAGVAPFVWPRARTYMSRAAALRRAALLESYGATVAVCRSLPVVWPDTAPDGGAETATEWAIRIQGTTSVQPCTGWEDAAERAAQGLGLGLPMEVVRRETGGDWQPAEDGGDAR